jgi:hypothetical protein
MEESRVIGVPTLTATRYLQPLREGGSLPAVVETEDGLVVVKFRGAGQGPRALIAELLVGLVARTLGLRVPDLFLVRIPDGLAREQRDPEIRELVLASAGVNVGLRYLDGAFNFDAGAAGEFVEPGFADAVVWLDAYVTNPDRTPRNPNLLVWERRPWLIDHGSALYAHHAWHTVDDARTRTPFPMIGDHVLLGGTGDLAGADRVLAARLGHDRLAEILEAVPDALLEDPLALGGFATAGELRARYLRYLTERLAGPRHFVGEAERQRAERRERPPGRKAIRR